MATICSNSTTRITTTVQGFKSTHTQHSNQPTNTTLIYLSSFRPFHLPFSFNTALILLYFLVFRFSFIPFLSFHCRSKSISFSCFEFLSVMQMNRFVSFLMSICQFSSLFCFFISSFDCHSLYLTALTVRKTDFISFCRFLLSHFLFSIQ